MDRNCYICNKLLNIKNRKSYQNIYAATQYSQTPLTEYIIKFLEFKEGIRFKDNNLVCQECAGKLNDYDLACTTAERIENELKATLHSTEQAYLKQGYIEFLETNDDSVDQKPVLNITDVNVDLDNYMLELKEYEQPTSNEASFVWNESSATEDEKHITELNTDDETPSTGKGKHKRHKSNEVFACEHCPETFSSKTMLKNHTVRYHNPKKCGICQKQFVNPMQLRAHQRSEHEVQYSYECGICGKSMKTEALLKEHINQHETSVLPANENPICFRCDLCGQIENCEEEFAEHTAKHGGQLKCILCGTIVKHKANLILHMRIHTGAKFFQCDKCGKEFVHKSSLRMHFQTTHSEVRQKQCPECPLSFKTTSQLNQHIITHTGIKSHQCPECGKLFAQRYNMVAHYKLHVGIGRSSISKKNKTHDCSECNESFYSLSHLKTHKRKKHGT